MDQNTLLRLVTATPGSPSDSPTVFTRRNVHLSSDYLGEWVANLRVTRLGKNISPRLGSTLWPTTTPLHRLDQSTIFGHKESDEPSLLGPHRLKDRQPSRSSSRTAAVERRPEPHRTEHDAPQDKIIKRSKRQFVTGTSRVVTHRSTIPAQSSLITEV